MKPKKTFAVSARPAAKPPKRLLLRDALVVCVLVAMVSFVLGSRWQNLSTSWFSNDANINSDLPEDLDFTEVEQVYDMLRLNFDGDLNEQDLLDGLKRGLAEATGDDYTAYFNADEAAEFRSDLNGTFSGIGAELGVEDGQLIIIAPLEGFPAEGAGLRPQDAILKINGEDAVGLSVEGAVSKIRGPKGTDVTLTVQRGDDKPFDVTITRQDITVPSVTTSVEDGIGILRLSRFSENIKEEAREAAQSLKDQGVSGIVLDLRNNGGGYLEGAVDVAGIWLDNETVVIQKQGDTVTDTRTSGKNPILAGVPTVVLINEGSASASEIVAGALKDHNAATLIGVTSFGKGSVQELKSINSGGALKVTVARWFTPHGNTIDQDGIKPDVEVKLSDEDIEAERDRQLQRAKAELSQN